MEKSKKWAFTCWKKPAINELLIDYMIWQKEYTQQSKLEHYQGYIEFKKEYKLFQVKSLFKDKTMHCEIAKKNRQANFLYCTKNESYAGERYEFGNCYTGATDWNEILD